MATLIETVKGLDKLRHSKAVCESIIEHLEKFVDDGVEGAEYRVLAEGAIENEVPSEVIREFIENSEEEIRVISKEIREVERSVVVAREDTNEKDASKKTSNKKDSNKKASKKGIALGKKTK